MDKNYRVIEFNIEDKLDVDIKKINDNLENLSDNIHNNHIELDKLKARTQELLKSIGYSDNTILFEDDIEQINRQIDEMIFNSNKEINIKYNKLPNLQIQDLIYSVIAGLTSVLVDIIFVGTPEVVKIYRGGENFDGSILTSALRKVGIDNEGDLTPFLEWFSDKCKVPYDISLKKDILSPNNHRLRSLAHDPFFGLLFAVADIILGTTTCIDDTGKLTILSNKNKATDDLKWLAVIYYIGHLVSDICTARGIPIPGLFITQFFTNEDGNTSLADIVEGMYMDGYDLRHMASMSVPVFIKNSLINLYLKLNTENYNVVISISEKEKCELDLKIKENKMMFIANSISTLGNTLKFILPPNCGNPCALNLVQWADFIHNGIFMVNALTREFSTEEVMYNRKVIEERWDEMLS